VTTEPLPLKGVPKPKVCKGCGRSDLKLPHPGPRCHRCNLAWKAASKTKRHERDGRRVYGIPLGFFARLFDFQGRKCAICPRSKGKTVRLQRDHNHKIDDPSAAIRGLVCGKCNTYLAWIRDDPETAERMARYLRDPPAQQLLREIEREGGEVPT